MAIVKRTRIDGYKNGEFSATIFLEGREASLAKQIKELEEAGYTVKVGETETAKHWEVQCKACRTTFDKKTNEIYTLSELNDKGIRVIKNKVQVLCKACQTQYIHDGILKQVSE